MIPALAEKRVNLIMRQSSFFLLSSMPHLPQPDGAARLSLRLHHSTGGGRRQAENFKKWKQPSGKTGGLREKRVLSDQK